MASQEILGKGFGAFKLCCGLRRAKDFQPGSLEGIYHTDHQRRFRAYDGQADGVVLGKGNQRRDIGWGDIDVGQIAFQCGTRITWGHVNRICQWRLGRFPGQRMFTPAVANN
ncbi:hypothetical protein D3C76_1426080 [compost metagenome]